MRIDIVTIFPEYLAPLQLSLAGKAQTSGLIELNVHDLRQWTRDRHRTVDDTPYGGGAGMVLKPEPWGEAFDALGLTGATVVVPTPSGVRFDQRLAEQLASCPRLIFACGRYEGIDQRVADYAAAHTQVLEVSLGDYVLNGGEAAALVMIEAITRLLPGFMGNAASLAEESHQSGLLEYPTYTKPASWRGQDVPPVLLSGDHGAIARWRHEQSVRRTATRRPDLLPASAVVGLTEDESVVPQLATAADVAELHVLTLACWLPEAQLNDAPDIPPLHETPAQRLADLAAWQTWVVRHQGRLIGSVRGRLHAQSWEIGRLMVVPDLSGRGLGRQLLEWIETHAPAEAQEFWLVTGTKSERNLKFYKKAGYRPSGRGPAGTIRLAKRVAKRN